MLYQRRCGLLVIWKMEGSPGFGRSWIFKLGFEFRFSNSNKTVINRIINKKMIHRKILFRGLKADDKKFVFGNYMEKIKPTEIEDVFLSSCIHDKALSIHVVDPKTVGQFTGLKDKKGSDIYEGDILKVNGQTKVYYNDDLFEPPENIDFELTVRVIYNDSIGAFDLETIEEDLNMKHWGFYGEDTQGHLEIIGNIHEKK